MSRSEFFTRAAQHYIGELDAHSLTARINAAIDLVDSDESSEAAVSAARRTLVTAENEW